MYRALWIFLACGFLCGCGTGGTFPVAKTTGKVTCNGQPVPHAMVFFEPLMEGNSALVGKQGFAVAGEDGTFTISSYGTNDGAVIGKHRVRVGRPHAEDYPKFQCDCVVNSELDVLKVEVVEGKDNHFELVLPPKTGEEQPLPISDEPEKEEEEGNPQQ